MRSLLQFKLQIALMFAMAVWGLSWTNAKILGVYTSPPLSMFWRFFLATICFIPIMKWTNHSFKIPQSAFKFVFLNGFFMTVYNYFYFRGTQLGFAGAGGVIVTTLNPIFTSLLAVVILKDLLKSKDILGAFLGLTGGALIIKIWSVNYGDLVQNGNIHFLLAALSWAFVTLITTSSKDKLHFIPYSFWSITIAGLFSFFISVNEPLFSVFNYGWNFWLNLFILSAGAMVFGTTIYFLAAVRLGSRKASAYIFSVPVTAMGFSMVILGESLDWNTALGSVLAISGVYLINKS
ncbi:MAG: hypothetical protein CMF83_00930 [Candidatus Marinimicrobia bacterium]|nr:hypothetical protein [Candidatus Neomarinimicrobiota bacterium]